MQSLQSWALYWCEIWYGWVRYNYILSCSALNTNLQHKIKTGSNSSQYHGGSEIYKYYIYMIIIYKFISKSVWLYKGKIYLYRGIYCRIWFAMQVILSGLPKRGEWVLVGQTLDLALYLCICICVFVFVYLCFCICVCICVFV